MPKYDKCRWNGKLVSESVYKQRLAQSGVGKNSKLIKTEETVEAVQLPSQEPSGRRIVELAELGKQLWCVACKEVLSLENIENERRKGLGSILSVRCHKCRLINIVSTSEKYASADGRSTRFDVNFKAAMGALHSGIGWTQLNKLLSCLNIPSIDYKTFKRYEDNVRQTVETLAKQSCQRSEEAAVIKQEPPTIQNAEQIEESL